MRQERVVILNRQIKTFCFHLYIWMGRTDAIGDGLTNTVGCQRRET